MRKWDIKSFIEKGSVFIRKNSPPGMNLSQERFLFWFGIIAGAVYSLFAFFGTYFAEYDNLFRRQFADGKRILIHGAMMPNFKEIFGTSDLIFIVAMLWIFSAFVWRWLYFHQGTKSIYLMKRLPKRTEFYKMVFLIPVLTALFCVIVSILFALLYFAFYMFVTPKACIAPNQWQIFWEGFL